MKQGFNPAKLPENARISFYGALFAIAKSDGVIGPEEFQSIFESIDHSNLSDSAKDRIQSYAQCPPLLRDCLDELGGGEDNLCWGLVFYLLYIAWADRDIKPGEEQAIRLAQEKFNITDGQLEALRSFVKRMAEIRDSKMSGKELTNASKAAISDLTSQGVPVLEIFTTLGAEQPLDYESVYTEEKFWKKLRKFAATAGREIVEKVLLLFYAAQEPNVPIKVKGTIYAALGYFVLPIDAVPDVIPGVGFGDDLVALLSAVAICAFYITPAVKKKARQKMDDWFGDT